MCEPEFLHDLVLKMRTFIYTPDDLVCRKGEVAREMFIIADGLLEVIRSHDRHTFLTRARLRNVRTCSAEHGSLHFRGSQHTHVCAKTFYDVN